MSLPSFLHFPVFFSFPVPFCPFPPFPSLSLSLARFLTRSRSDWSLFRCESNTDWGYQRRAFSNEITIIKRVARSRSHATLADENTATVVPSRGSQMNYRVERRKSPANFSFKRPSIFHRVASLLTPIHPRVFTKRAIATINYTVYFDINMRVRCWVWLGIKR